MSFVKKSIVVEMERLFLKYEEFLTIRPWIKSLSLLNCLVLTLFET